MHSVHPVTVVATMIDNETFRLRIGLFHSSKRSGRWLGGKINRYTPFDISNNIVNSIYNNNIDMHKTTPTYHSSFNISVTLLWIIYAIFMVYVGSLSLAMTVSIDPSFHLGSSLQSSLLLGSQCYLIPCIACSHVKLLSIIISSFLIRNAFVATSISKLKFASRFRRLSSLCILWLFTLNFLLIAVVNPSLLNPGPQSLSVLYQNVQGLIPVSQLSSDHPVFLSQ